MEDHLLSVVLVLYNLQETSILVPEYICEEVIVTLKNLKMNVIYYSINKMLEPEYNKILKKLIKT